MPYIYSTATNDNIFPVYKIGPSGIPEAISKIHVAGGANRPMGKALVTSYGVRSEVTEDELAMLKDNTAFIAGVDAGHFIVSDSKTDPEKVAADMTGRDESAPLVEEDIRLDNAKLYEQSTDKNRKK